MTLQEAGTRAGEELLPRTVRLRRQYFKRRCEPKPESENLAAMAADVIRRAPRVECFVTRGLA